MTEQAGSGQDDRDRNQGAANGSSTRSGTGGTSRSGQAGRQSKSRPSNPGADLMSDFQRWLIRSSAKNMRKEIGGQVRKTFGGGRSDAGDVWDTATTEIPPEVGEAPECQWCPICRAARRMRESGTGGLSDHLSSAGDVVASAVQEALRTFDSVVARGGSSADKAGSRRARPDSWAAGADGWDVARDSWAAQHGAQIREPEPRAAQPVNDEPEGPDESDDRG